VLPDILALSCGPVPLVRSADPVEPISRHFRQLFYPFYFSQSGQAG
jgi:hypothetical protein